MQSKAEVEIWLYEQTDLRIRGRIIVRAAAHPLPPAPRCLEPELSVGRCAQGFDEYMNLVLADAKEVSKKKKTEKELGARRTHRPPPAPPGSAAEDRPPSHARRGSAGRILLKGDNITLMMEV